MRPSQPPPQRHSRFAAWSDVRAASVSGKAADQQPFFAGAGADRRMDEVRTAINEIRSSWERYPDFMNELRDLMARTGVATTGARLSALLAAEKDWTDGAAADGAAHDYSALRLYTSALGYRQIFAAINAALRTEQLPTDAAALRAATFLVELLTIDLFNYRAAHPSADGFTGTVYRGMSLPRAELDRFAQAAAGPLTERYLAVPLAMVSTTLERDVALAFALHEAERAPGEQQPVLWEIRVASLAPELLRAYRERHPKSVVTSLCAVPIDVLSDYPAEQEVLLRGPFLQLVRLGVDRTLAPRRDVYRLEAVMHNTNRDHRTAIASNRGADRAQRELFRTLVLLDRCELCADLARDSGQAADADSYRALAAQTRATVASMLIGRP